MCHNQESLYYLHAITKYIKIKLVNFSWERPFSLQSLGKLRTLILDHCDIRDTDANFFPEKLETLCIWECNLPRPLDLPILKNLLKLEIRQQSREILYVLPNCHIWSNQSGRIAYTQWILPMG